jgi:flagellar basal body-associated protein FliL
MKKKTPKVPKIGKPKISIPKIAVPKIKAPEIKLQKRRLPVKLLLIVLLIALAAVGFGYVKEIIFKEKAPQKTEESVKEEQSKEPADIDMTGLENHLATDFIKALKSDRYMIKYKTTTEYNGESFEVETTYAVNGKSIAMASGDRATIVKDKKVYMLDHTNKRILSWDVTKSNDLKRIDTDGLAYVGSSDTDGLACEEYASATTQLKLYFKDGKLFRIATVINKMNVVMDAIEVSKKVPDSLFQVPPDYFTTEID